jgi:hypothetical protein
MENIMMLATALGIVGGGLCAYMACKSLVLFGLSYSLHPIL